MAIITSTETHSNVVEALKRALPGGTVTSQGTEDGVATVILEGTFKLFDLKTFEVWGGEIRFTVKGRDVEPERDEEFYDLLGHLTSVAPDVASLLTALTTISVEKKDDGGVWEDVTAEFKERADNGRWLKEQAVAKQ